ncbi:hypothetical protein XANCAGTX0491_009335 [Xanthoria calcicola]
MSTPTNGLGTMYLGEGERRSQRLARIAVKDLSEEDIRIKFIHLQGNHQLQDRTIQALRQQIERLHATFSTKGGMWTPIEDTIVQYEHPTVAILENSKAQVPRVLPMVGHALAKTIVLDGSRFDGEEESMDAVTSHTSLGLFLKQMQGKRY